jgi:HlyD family secretion protein
VFVEDDAGVLTLKPVTIGLSSWEYTEVLAGLREGDEVLQVPLSLVQQQELLQRIRSRSGVPGVQRNRR